VSGKGARKSMKNLTLRLLDSSGARCPLIFFGKQQLHRSFSLLSFSPQALAFDTFSLSATAARRARHPGAESKREGASAAPLAEVSGKQQSLALVKGFQCHFVRAGKSGLLPPPKTLNPPSLFLSLTESGGSGVGRVRLGHDGVGHGRHRREREITGEKSWGDFSRCVVGGGGSSDDKENAIV